MLKLNAKCGGDGKCKCTKQPKGITTTKDATPGSAKGFFALVHARNGETFTLKRALHGGDTLGDSGTDIYGVTKVLVYYWEKDNNCNTPLLLKVVKSTGSRIEYYYRYDEGEPKDKPGANSKIWKHIQGNYSLQDRLDDRNCGRNGAVPLNIQNPAAGTLPDNVPSECLKETRKIALVGGLKPLAGSEYITATYQVKGDNTKISRVEYKKNKIGGIIIPTDVSVFQVRLYFNTGISKAPLMFNLQLQGGEQKWYYSTDGDGTNWGETGEGGNAFYSSDGRPTEALAKKLDELACSYHRVVTMDISLDKSKTCVEQKQKYCCEEHSKKHEGKVTVTPVQISCTRGHSLSITAYQHSINTPGLNLAGIYYTDRNNTPRKMIVLNTQRFPIGGSPSVYVFYCNRGNNPVLIYVDYNGDYQDKVKGWYKQSTGDDSKWNKLQNGLNKAPYNINDCRETNWNKLVEELGCGGYSQCNGPTQSLSPVLGETNQSLFGERGSAGPTGPSGDKGDAGERDDAKELDSSSNKVANSEDSHAISALPETQNGLQFPGEHPQKLLADSLDQAVHHNVVDGQTGGGEPRERSEDQESDKVAKSEDTSFSTVANHVTPLTEDVGKADNAGISGADGHIKDAEQVEESKEKTLPPPVHTQQVPPPPPAPGDPPKATASSSTEEPATEESTQYTQATYQKLTSLAVGAMSFGAISGISSGTLAGTGSIGILDIHGQIETPILLLQLLPLTVVPQQTFHTPVDNSVFQFPYILFTQMSR